MEHVRVYDRRAAQGEVVMPLTTRAINNTGDALCGPDGTVLAAKEVSFQLVNTDNKPTDAWDAISGERIAPVKKTVVTDASGEFTVSLWPNDRGSEVTYYLCTSKGYPSTTFRAALASGASALKWIDFMAQGLPLTAQPVISATPLILPGYASNAAALAAGAPVGSLYTNGGSDNIHIVY